jgi:hypothetical protein
MEKSNRSFLSRLWQVVLALLVLAVAGAIIIAAVAGVALLLERASTRANTSRASLSTMVQPYTAGSPGSGCDHGGGVWSYANPINYELKCQADGTLMSYLPRTSNADYTAAMFWNGSSHETTVFPQSFQVAVEVTFTSATPPTYAGIILGDTYSANVLRAYLYNDSVWKIDRCKGASSTTVSGRCSTVLASGPLLTSSGLQHTLNLAVQGSAFTFSIDGSDMASVEDSSVPTVNGLGLEMYSFGQGSVRFSNFTFTPQ